MVTITDTLNIIGRLLLAPPCLATRRRPSLLSRWTRTVAVAIIRTGRPGMGFKISRRAIGKRAGLQLPFSTILTLRSRAESGTVRARRNNPGGLLRLLGSCGVGCWSVSLRPPCRSLAVMPPDYDPGVALAERSFAAQQPTLQEPFCRLSPRWLLVAAHRRQSPNSNRSPTTLRTARLQVGSLLDDDEPFRVPINEAVN